MFYGLLTSHQILSREFLSVEGTGSRYDWWHYLDRALPGSYCKSIEICNTDNLQADCFCFILGTSGPITAAHSGQIPAPLSTLSTAGPSVSQPSLLTVHSSWGGAIPKYETRGVSTKQPRTQRIPINDSLLTMLLKLYTKLAGKSKHYVPPSVCTQSSSQEHFGTGAYYLQRLLNKLCQQSAECARALEDLYSAQQQPKDPSTSKKGKAMDNETRWNF